MMKCLLLTLALVCAIHSINAAPADEVDCGKIDAVMEDQGTAQGLTLGGSDKYILPTTREELDKRCPEMSEGLKTLKRYNQKCNAALTQQVMSAVYKSRGAYNDNLCKGPADEQQKRLDGIKCVKENAAANVKGAEMKATILSQVLSESDIKDEKERIKRACCAVIQTKEDLIQALKPACEKHTPQFVEYMDSYTSESMAIICPDAEKMVKDKVCESLTPLKVEGVKSKYIFFLTPLQKVVKTLDH